MNSAHDELMRIKDVARIFNVDNSTITRWMKEGTIAHITLPSTGNRPRYRIRRSTVDTIINQTSATREYTVKLRNYWEAHNIDEEVLTVLQGLLITHGIDAAKTATKAVLLAVQTERRTPERALISR